MSGSSKAIASNVVVTGNGTGVSVDSTNGAATLNLVNSISANNTGAGIQVAGSGAAAVVRMTGVSLFSNGSGIASSGTSSSVYSYGDNVITGGGVPTRTLSKQ